MKQYQLEGHKLIYHHDRLNQYLQHGDCFPLYMEISPVGSCNHRCIFCAYDFIGYPNRRLDTDRTLELIDEMAECGIRSLVFAGEGEPLLHPDLTQFVSRAKRNGIDVGLFTNAQLLDASRAEELLPLLSFVRCSFNGGTRKNYSRVHQVREEVFDRVVKNLTQAAEIKSKRGLQVDIGAQFVLLPENVKYLRRAALTLSKTGIDYLAIKPFMQRSQQNYQLPEQFDIRSIRRILKNTASCSTEHFQVIARIETFLSYGERDYRHCYGTSFISALNSAGDMASCLPYWENPEYVLGNIYRQSFREIWEGTRRHNIKQKLEQTTDCGECPPNCRADAINRFLWDIRHPQIKHINFI